MIQLTSEELDNLKQKLEHEQWSSTAACKLQSAEFNDLISCALYFLEKGGKICEYKKPQRNDAPLADITGVY